MAARQILHGPADCRAVNSNQRSSALAPESALALSSKREPNVDAAVFGAGVIPILRAREKAVVAARRGVRMIVPVTLDLVIVVLVIIPMNVRLHDLMIIRATIVRAILRADQCRDQPGHRESR
jgi:hypothetical protein